MGAKAKAAIAKAERAIDSMTKLVAKLKADYDKMYAEQGRAIDLHMEWASYFQKKYPGETDMRARARTDETISEYMVKIAATKKAAADLKADCRAGLDAFTAEGDKIVEAVNQVTALINAKRAKRNSSNNVVKKLINKVKTKSLGDLVAEKEKVIKVINDIGPVVDQVKNDINFRK